jgi:hypothetical protein
MSVPGQWNSSITRVRPFFQSLLRRDPSGRDWLPNLLSLSKSSPLLETNPGELLPWVTITRSYKDKVLKRPPYNIQAIRLERCFEYRLPPPKAFLSWLIDNASPEVWAKKRKGKMREETREWRDKLFCLKGADARRESADEARALLDEHGSQGSDKKWWAFEGFTEVDCYLETDRLILLIEGKRTEPLSKATDWYTGRNQLMRNLEAIGEKAGGKNFGVMVLAEDAIPAPSRREVRSSVPHLTSEQRESLMKRFWGCFTWEQACRATGVEFGSLPYTTQQAVEKLQA